LKFKILIIEDNPESAETLQLLLTMDGHDARAVTSSLSALELLTSWIPNTIICDIGLPVIDGYTLCKKMKADPRLKNCRMIALTGYSQADDILRAQQAGFDLHLTKPIDPHELERLLAGND
jgi:CheY-like chemotaxis protein